MRHPSVIDTVIGRFLRRSLLGDRRIQLLPDHFERRRITGQVRQRGLPLVADRLLLLVRESVVQINGEPINPRATTRLDVLPLPTPLR